MVCKFDIDDIDNIVSITYNYGITLMSLEQIDLSEKFIGKAISLMQFVSPILSNWLDHMQVFIFIVYYISINIKLSIIFLSLLN